MAFLFVVVFHSPKVTAVPVSTGRATPAAAVEPIKTRPARTSARYLVELVRAIWPSFKSQELWGEGLGLALLDDRDVINGEIVATIVLALHAEGRRNARVGQQRAGGNAHLPLGQNQAVIVLTPRGNGVLAVIIGGAGRERVVRRRPKRDRHLSAVRLAHREHQRFRSSIQRTECELVGRLGSEGVDGRHARADIEVVLVSVFGLEARTQPKALTGNGQEERQRRG